MPINNSIKDIIINFNHNCKEFEAFLKKATEDKNKLSHLVMNEVDALISRNEHLAKKIASLEKEKQDLINAIVESGSFELKTLGCIDGVYARSQFDLDVDSNRIDPHDITGCRKMKLCIRKKPN